MKSTLSVAVLLALAATVLADGLHLCWRDMYNRGLGNLPNYCGDSKEFQAGLCYERCDTGFMGVGPLCLETCAGDHTDIGLFCVKGVEFKLKKTHSRGVGHMPSCAPDADHSLGLCHDKCKTGYVAYGPICWQTKQGTVNYPNRCNVFLYGKTAEDCQDFNSVLHEAGIETAECISALGNAVLHSQLTGTKQCTDLVKGIMYQFGNTTFCHKATF